MRSRDEIQRAHDLLEPLLCGDLEHASVKVTENIEVLCRTLCWVLNDGQGLLIDSMLAGIELQLREDGYVLPSTPDVPFPMIKRPGEG
jgi:hypothetical protein